jgi:hypothetical protein
VTEKTEEIWKVLLKKTKTMMKENLDNRQKYREHTFSSMNMKWLKMSHLIEDLMMMKTRRTTIVIDIML